MKRAIATLLALLAMVDVAAGDKLLVLQSEGTADAASRAKVDAAVVKLARTTGADVTLGEITYSDAATLVGCAPQEDSCRNEVVASLGVDEIVTATVNTRPGGLEVTVRRAGKRSGVHAANGVVAAPDQLDPIAPLFGVKPIGPPPPVEHPIGPQPPTDKPAEQPPTDKPAEQPPTDKPAEQPPIEHPTAATTTTPEQPAVVDATRERRRNRLRIAGMAGGGGMVLIGFLLWGSAAGVQGDIDNFQVGSQADLDRLRDLEAKGDSYAGWGNLMVLGGLVLGGISTYYYIKARRRRPSTTTAVTPMIFDHGGGIALTFGGLP